MNTAELSLLATNCKHSVGWTNLSRNAAVDSRGANAHKVHPWSSFCHRLKCSTRQPHLNYSQLRQSIRRSKMWTLDTNTLSAFLILWFVSYLLWMKLVKSERPSFRNRRLLSICRLDPSAFIEERHTRQLNACLNDCLIATNYQRVQLLATRQMTTLEIGTGEK